MLDYYDLLGVSADSSQQEIHSSYRRRIRTLHPDRFSSDEDGLAMARQMSGLLNLAWETLSRPDTRADYDSRLHHGDLGDGDGHRDRSTDRPTARDADSGRLHDVLDRAARLVARTNGSPDRPGVITRPLRVAALGYRATTAHLGDPADALAVAAAFRDVVADGTLDPHESRVLEDVAATAIDLLGTRVRLSSGSWLERGVRPATPASLRRRLAQVVSGAAVGLVSVAAVAAGIDLHAGHGTPWVPFVPDGAAPTPAMAASGRTLVVALVLALVTLIASRWLGAGGRAAVSAQPTMTVHLDTVDRLRFDAGRRFRTLPERKPEPQPAGP